MISPGSCPTCSLCAAPSRLHWPATARSQNEHDAENSRETKKVTSWGGRSLSSTAARKHRFREVKKKKKAQKRRKVLCLKPSAYHVFTLSHQHQGGWIQGKAMNQSPSPSSKEHATPGRIFKLNVFLHCRWWCVHKARGQLCTEIIVLDYSIYLALRNICNKKNTVGWFIVPKIFTLVI